MESSLLLTATDGLGLSSLINLYLADHNKFKMGLPVVPAMVHDCTGKVYQVGRKLGKGGFATCYQAQTGNAVIALKAVNTDGMPDKVADKLKTELQIHSKMRHRNIVAFHRAFSLQQNVYIELELCSNGTLKDMIGRRTCLSLPEIRRFGLELCGALHYLHLRNVTHRDIKAANIFLDSHMSIKLGDFGLAAILATAEEYGELERRITVCGTPNYIAPEVLSKKKGHNTKADLWSLGVLLYHMMTGDMPFSSPQDKDNISVFNRVAAAEFAWPEKNGNQLTAEAKDLVLALLQKDERLRPDAIGVAQLPFFATQSIPARLESKCTTESPSWLKIKHPREMKSTAPKIGHKDMLVVCGLVPLPSSDVPSALFNAIRTEVENNRGPQLPLDGIYEWKDQLMRPPQRPKVQKSSSLHKIAASTVSSKTAVSVPTEPAILLSPSQGSHLLNQKPRLAHTARAIDHALKKRPNDGSVLGSLPPTVIHSCEQSKWGTGFVLSDGSVGVISNRRAPPKMVVVGAALPYFLPVTKHDQAEKENQDPARPQVSKSTHHIAENLKTGRKALGPVPPNLTCFFYERDQHNRGLPSSTSPSVLVHAESSNMYQTTAPGSNGSKLDSQTDDPYVNERCRLLTLWAKFANYMGPKVPLNLLQPNVIRDAFVDPPSESQPSPYRTASSYSYTPEPRILAVQSLGNVRVWAWSNGGMQFDYPDGGKICIDGSGRKMRWLYQPVDDRFQRANAAAMATAMVQARSPPASPHEIPSAALLEVEKCTFSTLRNLTMDVESVVAMEVDSSATSASFGSAMSNRVSAWEIVTGADNEELALLVGRRIEVNALRNKLGFARDVLVMWNDNGGVGEAGTQKLAYVMQPAELEVRDKWNRGGSSASAGGGGGGSGAQGLLSRSGSVKSLRGVGAVQLAAERRVGSEELEKVPELKWTLARL